MEKLSEILKSKNLKVTSQRLAVYSFLLNTKSHPSADTIYSSLKNDYPAMSPSTVYKNLKILCDAGLVTEINVGEDSFRYDANTTPHSHLICSKCHNVYDFIYSDNLSLIKNDIESSYDFLITSEKLFFYGLCKSCK